MPWAGTTGPLRSSPGRSTMRGPIPRTRCCSWATRRASANRRGPSPPNVEVVAASQVIEMHEHPAMALREKKDSSITVGCDLVKNGRADAIVTAGHTGAAMAAAVLRIGRLAGVDRPALAVQMVRAGKPFVLLDIGANPDSTPENLLQYARMGAIFAERVVGIPAPRVALLSIGEEKGKGDLRIQRATELLDASDLRFVGNVEGKDLVSDHADVVVTDAVTGNVVIKFFEGLSTFIFDLWRGEFRRGIRGKLAYLLLRSGIGRIRKVFDYETAGGSPLLGVKGAVIITHGRARRRMVGFACAVAAETARTNVPGLIADALREDALRVGGLPRCCGGRGRRSRRPSPGRDMTDLHTPPVRTTPTATRWSWTRRRWGRSPRSRSSCPSGAA